MGRAMERHHQQPLRTFPSHPAILALCSLPCWDTTGRLVPLVHQVPCSLAFHLACNRCRPACSPSIPYHQDCPGTPSGTAQPPLNTVCFSLILKKKKNDDFAPLLYYSYYSAASPRTGIETFPVHLLSKGDNRMMRRRNMSHTNLTMCPGVWPPEQP